MRALDHDRLATDEWRPGVTTRMRVSALSGSAQLCVFEQWCSPGTGAPTHLHAVEEVLCVLAGDAEIWVGDERRRFGAGSSVIVPAGARHCFTNVGTGTLHVLATLAAPIFEAAYEDAREVPRRWVP